MTERAMGVLSISRRLREYADDCHWVTLDQGQHFCIRDKAGTTAATSAGKIGHVVAHVQNVTTKQEALNIQKVLGKVNTVGAANIPGGAGFTWVRLEAEGGRVGIATSVKWAAENLGKPGAGLLVTWRDGKIIGAMAYEQQGQMLVVRGSGDVGHTARSDDALVHALAGVASKNGFGIVWGGNKTDDVAQVKAMFSKQVASSALKSDRSPVWHPIAGGGGYMSQRDVTGGPSVLPVGTQPGGEEHYPASAPFTPEMGAYLSGTQTAGTPRTHTSP